MNPHSLDHRYPTLKGLTKPNGITRVDPDLCAPHEVVYAAFEQDSQLQNGGWRVYNHEKYGRGHHVNHEFEWIGALAQHYGKRLFTMTPTEICDAHRKLVERMNTVNHATKISRTGIDMLTKMSLWEQRQRAGVRVDEDEALAAA